MSWKGFLDILQACCMSCRYIGCAAEMCFSKDDMVSTHAISHWLGNVYMVFFADEGQMYHGNHIISAYSAEISCFQMRVR